MVFLFIFLSFNLIKLSLSFFFFLLKLGSVSVVPTSSEFGERCEETGANVGEATRASR